MLRTSEDWQKLVQQAYPLFLVLDPDGWDRENYQYSWHEELIDQRTFENRTAMSTCRFDTKMFEDIAKNGRIDYD